MINYPDVTGSCGEFDDVTSPVRRRNIPITYNWSPGVYDVCTDIYDVTSSRRSAIGQLCYETADWLAETQLGRSMRRLGRCLMRWRRYLMMSCILSLTIYLVFLDPSGSVNIPEGAINMDELEQELEIGRPVRYVSYKSPLSNHIYSRPWSNKSGYVTEHVNNKHAVSRMIQYSRLWTWADSVVTREELFPEAPMVDDVIQALATAPIVHVDVLQTGDYESGTSEKWVVTLDGGQKAMMKIVWEEKGGMKNGALCNFGYEMPSGEIAAFHLHRILEFRNTPFVSGRMVDLRHDIMPVASPRVAKQIKITSGNETCVEGKCYFCKDKLRLCPSNGQLEVSMAYWIPRQLKLYTYPPKYMPYSTPSMEEWGKIGFNNRTYCNKIRKIEPYEQDYYYYDIFDFAVLDTLMYHFDSKHYAIDDKSKAEGLTIRLDHGRAFCAYDRDDEQIFMAPITQCCTLRKSTYNKLVKHRRTLGEELQYRLSRDPLHPVLFDDWYMALDRRLDLILNMMEKCAKANGGWDKVLVNG